MSTNSNSNVESLYDEDFARLDAERDSSHTKRTVKRSVVLFRKFLGDNSDFETFSNEELNVQLRRFFGSIRKQDGSELKKTSLISLKYGISKHLRDSCNIDIRTEPIFSGCLNTFKIKVKDLKKKGKGDVQHKLVISRSDLHKLSDPDNHAFCLNTPSGLQKKVWFDIMYYLCRRGHENVRSMTKQTFAVSLDSSGLKYVHQVSVKDKFSGGDSYEYDTILEPRMYERQGDKRCPVKTYELYISKLHPELDALWQRPLECYREDDRADRVWYIKSPIGKNSLANWMAEISLLAGLSRRYTNHCILATSTSILVRDGYEARLIMPDTDFKEESSTKNCSCRLKEDKQHDMCISLESALTNLPADQNKSAVGFLDRHETISECGKLEIFSDDSISMEVHSERNGANGQEKALPQGLSTKGFPGPIQDETISTKLSPKIEIVHIGKAIDDWKCLRSYLDLKTDAELARILLDRYMEDLATQLSNNRHKSYINGPSSNDERFDSTARYATDEKQPRKSNSAWKDFSPSAPVSNSNYMEDVKPDVSKIMLTFNQPGTTTNDNKNHCYA